MPGIGCRYALFALLLICTELFAKGGNYQMEGRYNPRHIDSSPPEIRNSILRQCNEPAAIPRSSQGTECKLGDS